MQNEESEALRGSGMVTIRIRGESVEVTYVTTHKCVMTPITSPFSPSPSTSSGSPSVICWLPFPLPSGCVARLFFRVPGLTA